MDGTHQTPRPAGAAPQAFLTKAPRQFGGERQKARDWTFNLFFRVRERNEALEQLVAPLVEAVAAEARQKKKAKKAAKARRFNFLDLFWGMRVADQSTFGLLDPEAEEAPPHVADPLHSDWLSAVLPEEGVEPGAFPLIRSLITLLDALGEGADAKAAMERLSGLVDLDALAAKKPAGEPPLFDPAELQRAVALIFEAFGVVAEAGALPPPQAGLRVLRGGLVSMALYDILRIARLTIAGDPPVRASASVEWVDQKLDDAPITVGYTHRGLAELGVDRETLASFPDDFKDGMAKRANRLGDTGPNAPEHWDGALGLKQVHGLMISGFQIGDEADRPLEAHWEALRQSVKRMNRRQGVEGRATRLALSFLYMQFGMDALHVEIGNEPYTLAANADGALETRRARYRLEHFGFRDGLSQPFLDMDLGAPPAGGGTPGPDGTWAPVAKGEILVDHPDETGARQERPASPELRKDGSYLVFRKLEQDVAGFRDYLARTRPNDRAAQDRLAAEFMGRWPNGTPLALYPDGERELDHDPTLNDFRYLADDPRGEKCPLGSHVRRANPRDIGGGSAKRHRLLRRGIPYGGPLLGPDEKDDGRTRGLLFIAACARIDVQFELIQADWLNGGEFLGQARLGKCPIMGTNGGGAEDRFLEAGKAAPVRGIPAFTRTRGGDYFFVPGVDALYELAGVIKRAQPGGPGAKSAGAAVAGQGSFDTARADLPYDGYSHGDPRPDRLFAPERIERFVRSAVAVPPSAPPAAPIRVTHRANPKGAAGGAPDDSVVFLRSYEDVRTALSMQLKGKADKISVWRYNTKTTEITGDASFILGTDRARTAEDHRRLNAVLGKAWSLYAKKTGSPPRLVAELVADVCDRALAKAAGTGRIDLIHDLAAAAGYRVAADIVGVPGPKDLTELAIGLPFRRAGVGSLPADWLASLSGGRPSDPAFATLQIWSMILAADILGNVEERRELVRIAVKAGSEMRNHVRMLLANAVERMAAPGAEPRTLLDVFASRELFGQVHEEYGGDVRAYQRDAIVLLMELAGTGLPALQTLFGNAMSLFLEAGMDVGTLYPVNDKDDVLRQLRAICEADRLRPGLPLLLRQSEADIEIGGMKIAKGETIAALVKAAYLDRNRFPEPLAFRLDRPFDAYLTFGPEGGEKRCWGRHVARLLLLECFRAAMRLDGLAPVAGAQGEIAKIAGVSTGLKARFSEAVGRSREERDRQIDLTLEALKGGDAGS